MMRFPWFCLPLVVFGTTLHADIVTWQTNGTSNWGESENWSGAQVPGPADTAVIENGGLAVLDIGENGEAVEVLLGSVNGTGNLSIFGETGNRGVLATGKIFGGNGQGLLTVDGGLLRVAEDQSNFLEGFASGKVVAGAGGLFVDTNGFEAGVGADIGGTGALIKQGAGILILSGDNTYSGGVVLEAGVLRVASSSALGTGIFAIQGGTVGNLVEDDGEVIENNILVTGDFSIDVQGEYGVLEMYGNVDFGSGDRTITLLSEGLACFGGVISGESISLVAGGSSAHVMFCDNTTNEFTGTLRVGSGVLLELEKVEDAVAISGDMVIDAGGKVLVWLDEQFSASSNLKVNGLLTSYVSGTTTVNELTGTGSIVGDGSLGIGSDILVVHSGSFSGTIFEEEGAGQGLIKRGAGLLVLSGSSSYTSGTEITDGTLWVENAHALGKGNVAVTDGGVLHVDGGIVLDLGTGNAVTLENDGQTYYRKTFVEEEGYSAFGRVRSSSGVATEARILSGSAEGAREASLSFAAGSEGLASDVLVLDGTSGDTFVLQLSYDPTRAIAQFGSEEDARLGWLNAGVWTQAVDGNDGGAPVFVLGAWNASYGLGTYGVDVGTKTVWAVLNHDGDFAAVPEPSTWALIASTIAGVLAFRFARRRFPQAR